MKAPNGKPSNLTPEQWRLVRTPQFKAWFGDWENDRQNSGKVSGITKEPSIWYHSTKSDFLSKKGENIFKNPPFFFALSSDVSENIVDLQHYSHTKKRITTKPFFVRYKNPFDITKIDILTDKKLTSLIKKNTFYDTIEKIRSFQIRLGLPNQNKNTWSLTESPEIQEYILSQGYDSFFVYEDGYKNLGVFEPNQIKLADGTNTTFDGSNPDIRFAEGGKTKRTMKRIKRGGITYGKSHAEGGIPVKNQSTGDMLEVEGGEGIVNKRSMASDKKVKLNGKEMTICEAVSQLNQLEGGVQFSCDDVSDRQFIEAMAQGGELERGTRTEQEHIQVLKDLYAKRITPKQASERIAKDHLKEDSRYYSKLAKMEGKMADGGNLVGKYSVTKKPDEDMLLYIIYTESGEKVPSNLLPKDFGYGKIENQFFAKRKKYDTSLGLRDAQDIVDEMNKRDSKMADGGTTADNPFAEFGVMKSFKGDAIAKLDKLEKVNVNYCDVDKKHCSSSMGIERKDMPQIYEEYMDKYIDFLEENGVGYEMEYDVEVGKLKPTQENISVPRMKKILTRLVNGYYTDTQGAKLNPLSRRLIATRDGFILDGHHRWATLVFLSPKNKMDVLRINANIKDLVELSKNFDLASASQFAYGGKVSVKKPNYTSTDSNDLQTTFVKRGGFPQKGVLLRPIYAQEYDLTSSSYLGEKGYTDEGLEFSVGKVGLQRLNKRPYTAESNLKNFIMGKIQPNEEYSDLEKYKDEFEFDSVYGTNESVFLAFAKKRDKINITTSSESGVLRFYLYIPPRLQELKDGERLFDLIFDAVNSLTSNKDRDWSQLSQEAKQKSKEATKAKKGFADYFSKAEDMPKVITEYDPRHSYRLKTEDEFIAQYGDNYFDGINSSRYIIAKKSKRKLLGLKIPKKLDYIVRYLFAPIYFNHQEEVLVSLSEFYGNEFLEAYKLAKDETIRLNRTFITIDEEFVYSKDEIQPYEGGKILNEEEVKNNPNISKSDIDKLYRDTIKFNSSTFWVNMTSQEAEIINNVLFAKDGNNFVILPEIWGWLKYVNKMLSDANKQYFELGSEFLSIVFPFFYDYANSSTSISQDKNGLAYLITESNYMLQKEIDGVIYCASYPRIDSDDEIYVIPKALLDIGRYENMQRNRKVEDNFLYHNSANSSLFNEQIIQSIFMLPLAKIPSIRREYEPSDKKDAFYDFKENLQFSGLWLKTESPFFQTENFYDYNLKCDISFLPKSALRDDKMVFNYYLKEIFPLEENENVDLAKDITFKGIPMDEMHSLLGKSIDSNLSDGLQSIMIQSFRLRSEARIGKLGGGGLPYGDGFIPKKFISDSTFEKQINTNGDVYFTFGENLKQSNDYRTQQLFQKQAPNYFVNYVNRASEIFQISNFDEQIDLSYWGVGNGKRLETIVLNATLAPSTLPMNRRQGFNPTQIRFRSYQSYYYCVEPILVPKDSQILNAQITRKKNSFEQDIEALKTLMSIYKEDEIAVYSTLLQKLRQTQKKQEEFLQKKYFQNDLTNLLKLYARGQELGGQREVTQTKSGLSTPTGAPSELDIIQWKIVRSDEFKKWFGDWELAYETKNYEGVSKAINPRTAEPMVLYHGKGNMKAEATFFNLSGFPAKYLGANLSYSQWFANAYQELRVVYEFYAMVMNPLDFESLGLGEITPIEFKRLISSLYGYDITTRLVAEDRPQKLWMIIRSNPLMLKELRDKTPYDGIIMYEDNPQDILPSGEPNSTLDFVVFQNNQIKSADNRNQTFLLDSPDFRFEKGGLITKHL
jgi:hypothetical protein